MGKSKGPGGVPNRPLYCRASYLYQAAALFAVPQQSKAADAADAADAGAGVPHSEGQSDGEGGVGAQLDGISRRLLTDMRSVSLKTLMRISPNIKRTICKFCDTLLVEGKTCVSTVENKSKLGKKPWADVLVIKCKTCGREKRFPVSAARQPRKTDRLKRKAPEQEEKGNV